jgi:carboxypeptidase Q
MLLNIHYNYIYSFRFVYRCLLWTAEEEGLIGAFAYLNNHKSELEKFNLVIESDEGTFQPYGIQFHGSETAACIITEVAK